MTVTMKNGARVASAYTNVSVQSAAAPIIKIVPITAQKNPARSVKVVARVSSEVDTELLWSCMEETGKCQHWLAADIS